MNFQLEKDTKIRINRTYEDFKDYVKNYNNNDFENNIVEMDTVEGIKVNSVLLTLLWKNSNFMLIQKLEEKTSDAVSQYFNFLKSLLGYEKFHEYITIFMKKMIVFLFLTYHFILKFTLFLLI